MVSESLHDHHCRLFEGKMRESTINRQMAKWRCAQTLSMGQDHCHIEQRDIYKLQNPESIKPNQIISSARNQSNLRSSVD